MAASPTTSISFQNFFSATLTADITASSTDIPIDNVPNGSEGFLVIEPGSTTNHEVIYYTSKTATKVVCPSVADGRGQDDTTAVAHTSGATVIMAPIAAYFETLLALFTTTPQGWTSLSGTFTSPTYLGNRSYQFTTSVDQTSVLSRGMRLRTSRTVTAPTQCTSLNGTTQYYSCASATVAADFTFTDDFVVSAWIKVSSYATGAIVSRYNGTSGWELFMNSDGTIQLRGFNGGAANIKGVASYQSVPLNKWIHISAELDMNTATTTATTNYIMFDGTDVPCQITQSGTNPTSLIQAGNLEIGGRNGGTLPFPGKIAQVAIYGAKVTQANVRATISQGLSGSETSLISAYSFNNSINDLNGSSANNLTANGSAVATNADSPFTQNADGTPGGTYDYGIVTAVTASTLTVQVPEGCAIPTSGGISACSYSTFKAPFGMPVNDPGKWNIYSYLRTDYTTSSPTSSTWYEVPALRLQYPVGSWTSLIKLALHTERSTVGIFDASVNLSSASASGTLLDNQIQMNNYDSQGTSGLVIRNMVITNGISVNMSAATTTYVNYLAGTTNITFLSIRGARDLAVHCAIFGLL